jgi:hypothetical protein
VPQAYTITGRVLWDGVPVENVTLFLEKVQGPVTTYLTETLTLEDGTFEIGEAFPTGEGFNIVFENEEQDLPVDQVMSWAWIGLIKYIGQEVEELPDMEIGNGTFDFEDPTPGAQVSVAGISETTPLRFDWTPYSDDDDLEIEYWVEIVEDTDDQATVWQSELDENSSMEWDGITVENNKVEPGDYLWAVGAIVQLGDGLEFTIFSRFASMVIVQ